MPKLNIAFSGHILGANIKRVAVAATGEEKDVSRISAEKIALNILKGIWSISIEDLIQDEHLVLTVDTCEEYIP